MNYGVYTYYKIKNDIFEIDRSVSTFSKVSNVFWHCWCILYYKLLFLISDSDSLSFSVYRNIF